MKQPVLKVLLLATLAFFFTKTRAHSAELTVKTVGKTPSMTIDGDIDRDTVAKVITLADQLHIRNFSLHSGGGDVEAAIQLGRYFRKNESATSVLGGQTCASACLFLLAGSIKRYLLVDDDMPEELNHKAGRIGIHRPFAKNIFVSTSEATKSYKQTNDLIMQYLEEMNIPTSLLDFMNAVPPGAVRWLTEKEVALYFPLTDPVFEEIENSFYASLLEISKEEYIGRLQKLEQECPYPKSGDPQATEKFERHMRCQEKFNAELHQRARDKIDNENSKLQRLKQLLNKIKNKEDSLTPDESQELLEIRQWLKEANNPEGK